MVALRKSSQQQQHHHQRSSSSRTGSAAKNLVRRREEEPAREARKAPRIRVAVPAWVCGAALSGRGYALEMNAGGARFGGMGLKLAPGETVIVKLLLDAREPPVVIKGEVARYAPSAAACPELCVKFVDAPLDEHFRLSRFLDAAARR